MGKKLLLAALFFFSVIAAFCQSVGNLLVISTNDCELIVDGEKQTELEKGKPYRIQLTEGEHYVQCISEAGGVKAERNEIISIEPNKQKVLKLEFKEAQSIEFKSNSSESTSSVESVNQELPPITIADLTINIPGGLSVGAAMATSDDYEYSGYPTFYYALQKDDQLVIDLSMINKKGTNAIEIASYPDGNSIYSNYKFEDLIGLKVKIPETGIYRIGIGTNHTFDRKAHFVVRRLPGSLLTVNAKTKVVKKRKYEVVRIQEPMKQWVNSTSNETWKGGNAEVSIPVTLPPKVLEWYYIVSASREENDIESNLNKVSLFEELNTALMGVSPTTTVLNIGMNLITQPPGANYCDVYLLDYQNQLLYIQDVQFSYILEGTRENVMSSKVNIKGAIQGPYYLGIRNRDGFHGISIGIEVAAITYEDYYSVED